MLMFQGRMLSPTFFSISKKYCKVSSIRIHADDKWLSGLRLSGKHHREQKYVVSEVETKRKFLIGDISFL